MGYQVRNNQRMMEEQFLVKLKKSAQMYSEYAGTTLMFIFRKSKADSYDFYEVYFGKNNFMHLAGIKSANLSAVEFYEACINGTITRQECNPRHSVTNMFAKVSVMELLLDLRQSKCYKLGKKDLITKDNDFEMATGNRNGIVGYDARISKNGSEDINKAKKSVPTTLLTNPLTDYCTHPQKIMFILQKEYQEKKYHKIFYEIKKDLLKKECIYFPDYIAEQFSDKIFT